MTASLAIASAALAVWLYLMLGRGAFWRACVRDDEHSHEALRRWPRIVAIVPARDEGELIAESLGSLLNQDYPGHFCVVLVDDQSTDGTARISRAAAAQAGASQRLAVVAGTPLPPGWAGKLWAMKQGVDHAAALPDPPSYLLFADADIAFSREALRRIVARAEAQHYVLTSLMVKLRCESPAERALIPAFVFFFQMLYPFAWVNRPSDPTAAAAGGCMLVRSDALARAGGLDVIRGALIDDCALGQKLKSVGPVWLGLSERAHSLRAYPGIGDIGRMVSRSAYDQLRHSPVLLAGMTAGLALTFFAPPLLALFGDGLPRLFGALAWGLMAFAFQPMLRFYGVSALWGIAMPAIAACYLIFTFESAYQYARGRGGLWKGRVQAGRT